MFPRVKDWFALNQKRDTQILFIVQQWVYENWYCCVLFWLSSWCADITRDTLLIKIGEAILSIHTQTNISKIVVDPPAYTQVNVIYTVSLRKLKKCTRSD